MTPSPHVARAIEILDLQKCSEEADAVSELAAQAERLKGQAHEWAEAAALSVRASEKLAREIERLRAALRDLLGESEEIFTSIAWAFEIEKEDYPDTFLRARAALKENDDG